MGSEQNEGISFPPSEPKLCANGCEFFGSASNMNLCSKCYREIRAKEEQAAVETDVRNHQVIVKGVVDPTNLVGYIHKRTRKHVFVVKDEENKEEEKKEGEGKGDGEGKGEDEGKGDGEDKGEDYDKKMSDNIKRSGYYPSNNYSEFAYPPQIFSDENPNACSLM